MHLVDHVATEHRANYCNGCDKVLGSRDTFRTHVKECSLFLVTSFRVSVCPFCKFSFKREASLKQHILRKHADSPTVTLRIQNADLNGKWVVVVRRICWIIPIGLDCAQRKTWKTYR